MFIHHYNVRIYWEDTDAGGIVYHANYLKFAERARSEFVRSMGIVQSDLAQKGFVFAVSGMTIRFRRPARLDDLLDVRTRLVSLGGVRLSLEQTLWRGDEELVGLDVELAYMTLSGKPARIPPEIRDVLSGAVLSGHIGATPQHTI